MASLSDAERGTGLIGLVVVLGLLGGLVALVLSSREVGFSLPEAAINGTPDSPASNPPPAGGGLGSLVDASQMATCRADVAAIETAMGTSRAVLGVVPRSLPELITLGFLTEVPVRPGFTFTPELIGGTATGRVLVNGRPGVEGCSDPGP